MGRLQSGNSLTVCILERKLTKSKKTTEGGWDSPKPTEEKGKDVATEASFFFPFIFSSPL